MQVAGGRKTHQLFAMRKSVQKRGFMNNLRLQNGIDWLAKGGLNLFAVLDCGELPTAVTTILSSSNIPYTNYTRLVLIGHGGKTLWSQLQKTGMRLS